MFLRSVTKCSNTSPGCCFLSWNTYLAKTEFLRGAVWFSNRVYRVSMFSLSGASRFHELKMSLPVSPTHIRRYAHFFQMGEARLSGPWNISSSCCLNFFHSSLRCMGFQFIVGLCCDAAIVHAREESESPGCSWLGGYYHCVVTLLNENGASYGQMEHWFLTSDTVWYSMVGRRLDWLPWKPCVALFRHDAFQGRDYSPNPTCTGHKFTQLSAIYILIYSTWTKYRPNCYIYETN